MGKYFTKEKMQKIISRKHAFELLTYLNSLEKPQSWSEIKKAFKNKPHDKTLNKLLDYLGDEEVIIKIGKYSWSKNKKYRISNTFSTSFSTFLSKCSKSCYHCFNNKS
ncbi:MAG TPA: hypothetical protein VJH24_01885 [Candidatus Bilamarchaeaceae archaeon]|nr:hypothetical protein [Candidatus Bilamarchaeaceae archaeon]